MVKVNDIVLYENKSYMVKELKNGKAFCVGYTYENGLFVSTKGEIEIVNDDTIKKLTVLELKARKFENETEIEDEETEEPKKDTENEDDLTKKLDEETEEPKKDSKAKKVK